MSVLTASLILEVLAQKLLDGEVFTAWEVTEAVRALTTERISHADVRNIVNSEFNAQQMGTVNRQLCTLNDGRNSEAFVYYPNGMSADDHLLVGSNPVSSPVSVNLDNTDSGSHPCVADATTTDSGSDADSNITAEGRINIPKSLLGDVTPTGGSYDISFNGTLYCKIPNKDGRVRISINAIGFVGTKAKFSIDKNTIIIESV